MSFSTRDLEVEHRLSQLEESLRVLKERHDKLVEGFKQLAIAFFVTVVGGVALRLIQLFPSA